MDGDKFRRCALYAVIAVCVLFGPFLYGYYLGVDTARLPSLELGFAPDPHQHLGSASSRTKNFHFLIPATSATINLCELLLTGAILQYPEPIFLGWEHRGVFDGSKSHLFKITETANYLRSLPPSSDDDLVFLLDAYDVWLQLRPSVLVSRYYEILKKHDDALQEQGILGDGLAENGARIRSKILMGADKFPGPPNMDQPFVWAVPNSTYPSDVFGDETDTSDIDHRRPQYLNSGTIIGPVKDVLDLFEATEDAILREAADDDQPLEHSDQYYLGQVWGPQEVARQRLRNGRNGFEMQVPYGAYVPDTQGMRTEYGVCLDREQELFQVLSGWPAWLTKLKFDGSESPEVEGSLSESIRSKSWTLQNDVIESEGPYAALEPDELPDRPRGWENVSLGANAVNRQPYGLLHLNGDKIKREEWWPELWFHPYGETLQKAARRRQVAAEVPEVFMELDGISYKQTHQMFRDHEKAGAWTANGQYVAWSEMCGKVEAKGDLYTPESWTG